MEGLDSQTPPLAERMRPDSLESFQGQPHLLSPGRSIHAMLAKGEIASMILWGPPGSGKTTLAKLLSNATGGDFVEISAVSSGVREVRAVIQRAKLQRTQKGARIILFIDEIHRFNKAQQDALLHSVEQGILTLIGATTENPSFEIIPPLRSRCRVYVLTSLTAEDLKSILKRTLEHDTILRTKNIQIDDEQTMIAFSGGDARLLLHGLELSCLIAGEQGGEIRITREVIAEAFQRAVSQYDKDGEEHYNTISAFIKSVRGSDPDAALYWLARMIDGGEDPLFIARRLIILASEDIGNAEPNALLLATSCFDAVHSIGMPEARIILAQTTVYLAYCPKSNSSYRAIDSALHDVSSEPHFPVPLHLRNAVTGLMKTLGYGAKYRYPHQNGEQFIDENYFPRELGERQYYYPIDSGKEKSIRERLRYLWKRRKY